MKIYTLYEETVLDTDLDTAWDFFSNPRNLAKITPPEMGFTITSEHLAERMHPGMVITYKVTPLKGFSTTWVTEITHVEDKVMFVDEQRFGPYSFWHHTHGFRETENGVLCTDLVHYAVPGWFLSPVIHKLAVKPKLKEIFDFREKKVEELFGIAHGGLDKY